MDLVSVSVGIGLVVSLVGAELFGLAAGGMVVPGYLALFLDRPWLVVLTLLAGLLTYGVVFAASRTMILYGKRRTALAILVGFMVGAALRSAGEAFFHSATPEAAVQAADFAVVGFIIPGLLAIWIERQGLLETFSIVITSSAIVRLVLVTVGMELGG